MADNDSENDTNVLTSQTNIGLLVQHTEPVEMVNNKGTRAQCFLWMD